MPWGYIALAGIKIAYLPVAPMTSTLVTAAWGVSNSAELPEPLYESRVSLETVVLPGAFRLENRFQTDSRTALRAGT